MLYRDTCGEPDLPWCDDTEGDIISYGLCSKLFCILLLYSNCGSILNFKEQVQIDGFVEDCSISLVNALEIPQSCTQLWRYNVCCILFEYELVMTSWTLDVNEYWVFLNWYIELFCKTSEMCEWSVVVLMASCKTAVSLLTHWSYHSLALSRPYIVHVEGQGAP